MSRTFPKPVSADIEAQAAAWIVRRDAGLSPREETEFARWRAEDSRHAEAVGRHDQAWAVLERPLRSGQAESMVRQLGERATGRRRRRLGAVAGVLALAVAASWFWPAAKVESVNLAEAHAVRVLPERRTLPDGSLVELKFGAEIAVDYSGPLRRVSLRKGEAHFAVAKNKERPFVVEAAGVEIRAVGTAFSVQLGPKQVEVLVTEGRVSVDESAQAASPTSAAVPARPLAFVDAGTRFVVDRMPETDSPPVVTGMSPDELAKRLSWRAPMLQFSETTLADAVALMNQESAGHQKTELVLDDPALAKETVSGLFRADSTDTFVRLLEANFNVRAERLGDKIILRRAR